MTVMLLEAALPADRHGPICLEIFEVFGEASKTSADAQGAGHGMRRPVYSGSEPPPQPFGLSMVHENRTSINFYGGEPPSRADMRMLSTTGTPCTVPMAAYQVDALNRGDYCVCVASSLQEADSCAGPTPRERRLMSP